MTPEPRVCICCGRRDTQDPSQICDTCFDAHDQDRTDDGPRKSRLITASGTHRTVAIGPQLEPEDLE